MTRPVTHARRVGAVRPSHLMFTAGVGGVVDLPNFSVLVRGLDEWRYDHGHTPLLEPRLLEAVQRMLGPSVTELRPAPRLPGIDDRPGGGEPWRCRPGSCSPAPPGTSTTSRTGCSYTAVTPARRRSTHGW